MDFLSERNQCGQTLLRIVRLFLPRKELSSVTFS